MKIELYGYEAKIEIYSEKKGYQLGGISYARNFDLAELKKYQMFFNLVIDTLEGLINDNKT